ncbi:MAG TPA: hypothetical protein VFG73_09900 [Rhodanobacteraceae bacterium]|nr:hypothetical protein [Rhodanobacteraceae bacterium]
MIHRPLRLLALAAAASLLGACATSQTSPTTAGTAAPQDSKAVLKQRALDRWNLLIAHKGAEAWNYLTPGYRATISQQQYALEMNNRPVRWTHASVTKVDCVNPDSCTVYVMVDYDLMVPGLGGGSKSFAPLKETWLRVKNTWYYLPREAGKSTLGITQ